MAIRAIISVSGNVQTELQFITIFLANCERHEQQVADMIVRLLGTKSNISQIIISCTVMEGHNGHFQNFTKPLEVRMVIFETFTEPLGVKMVLFHNFTGPLGVKMVIFQNFTEPLGVQKVIFQSFTEMR